MAEINWHPNSAAPTLAFAKIPLHRLDVTLARLLGAH